MECCVRSNLHAKSAIAAAAVPGCCGRGPCRLVLDCLGEDGLGEVTGREARATSWRLRLLLFC